MIRLLRGAEAVRLLASDPFRQSWSALATACPWSSCFQDPAFVTTWYRCYAERFEPLLLAEFATDGALDGLLTLAVSRQNESLCCAGAHHAEYQVWLARPASEPLFIEGALDRLAADFPGGRVEFLFTPPGTPLNWSTCWRDRSFFRAIPRALMATGPGNTIRDSLRKKSNKSRLKRIEQAGCLRLERITDPAAYAAALEEIIPLCDFRQGAVHESLPFQDDPLKKAFYLAMFEQPGLLHVTVSRLDGRLVAAHIGMENRRQVLLGLITHAPDLARHSIGKFHILFLGLQLEQEGFLELDLTPGGEYKERFATHHDEAGILTVFLGRSAARRYRAKRRLIETAKRYWNLGRARETVARIRHHGTLIRPADLPGLLRSAFWGTRELRVYRVEGCAAAPLPTPLRRDSLEDLLRYQPAEAGQPPLRDFLRQAMDRLEEGHHVYTQVLDGCLAHYAWLFENIDRIFLPEAGRHLEMAPGSALLYCSYTHPDFRGRGLEEASLRRRLADAAARSGARFIYTCVLAGDTATCHSIEKLGFQYQSSLFRKIRFGKLIPT